MLVRMRIKPRPQPQTMTDLRHALIQDRGSLSKAERHYRLGSGTLTRAFQRPHPGTLVAQRLRPDYDLHKLAATCDCGELYFPGEGTYAKRCPACAMFVTPNGEVT